MTPADLRNWRQDLGVSQSGLARLLRMRGGDASRHVRRWEAGTHPIPGYLELLHWLYTTEPEVRQWLLYLIGQERRESPSAPHDQASDPPTSA